MITPNDAVTLRRLTLAHTIHEAFSNASAVHLRRWFVQTFVMDPTNLAILAGMDKVPTVLSDMNDKLSWPTIEHGSIGSRLIWAIDSKRIAPIVPDTLDSERWRNDTDFTQLVLHVHEPWMSLRYDPEGENWYTLVEPGQWQRHGKGNPSDNVVEHWLSRALPLMDFQAQPERFERWPMDPDVLTAIGTDSAVARVAASVSGLKKYIKAPTTMSRLRKALEQAVIMHVDPTTLNQIRQVTPFANGALCLTTEVFTDTAGNQRVHRPGDLLAMDAEYMVTNANTIRWNDQNRIPHAMSQIDATDNGNIMDADWTYLDEYEDELFLQVPTFWSFLTHAFPDPEERSAFLRLLGAAMFGSNLKVVAAMIGEPNAGKDTVINWLHYLMTGQVATLPFSAFTAHGDDDRGFASLLGARVAVVSGEVGDGRGSKMQGDKVKMVSGGGGQMRVAEKYEKPTTIWFDGMLWIQGNSVPVIQGTDQGLTNRLVAVEFKHRFPLQAKSFEADYRAEAPSFAQILFINYLRYEANGGGMAGINPPDTWKAFAKEFTDNANPHGFIESCIIPSQSSIPTTQFHQALSAMVGKFGSPYPVGPNYWPKRLRALGFQTKGPNSIRKQVARNGKPTWAYYLTLDSDSSDGMFNQQDWDNVLRDSAVTA